MAKCNRMSDAPRDGTEILVRTANGSAYVVSYDEVFASPWRVVNEFGLNENALTGWITLPEMIE